MKIGCLKEKENLMINKFASPNKDMVAKPKNCIKCNILLTKDNRVRKYGSTGYHSCCRECVNKRNLKYMRKRAQILKDNPLW